MRCRKRVRYLDPNIEQLIKVHRRPADPLLQALALQLLHHDERMSIVVLDFIDGADAGMVQQGGRPGFSFKALQRLAVTGQVIWKKLQRYVTAQARVFRLIYHAHSPAAQLADDLVMGNDLANHGRLAGRSLAGRGLAGHRMPSPGTTFPAGRYVRPAGVAGQLFETLTFVG